MKTHTKKEWLAPLLLNLSGKETNAGNTSGIYEGAVLGSGLYATS